MSDDLARERMIYNTLTDEDLNTPIGELPDGKVVVLQHVLRGPFGEELLARIDALNVAAVEGTQGGDEQ